MASIEYIEKRIAGKEKEIEKLEKKLSRIRAAEASGWTKNPYWYSEHDLKYTMQDIEEARQALDKYRADLATEKDKAASRNVPAILEFLERWKKHCTEYYGTGIHECCVERAKVKALARECCELAYGSPEREDKEAEHEEAYRALRCKLYGYFEKQPQQTYGGRVRFVEVKVRDGEYEYVSRYINNRTEEEAMEKLADGLNKEANRKYDFIIERACAIVGEITDASDLTVGAKDDLNGYILGTQGRAKVQTVGAGGYNIQCFHFRTLIHKA